MPANIFLLTHKCGNNFILDLLSRGPKNDNFIELTPEESADFTCDEKRFYNVRCRNFKKIHTERLVNLLGVADVKYFVFTRHPASFFRSATTYHLRGGEKWCKEAKQPHLEGKTLYESLHDCNTYGEQLVVSMKHFGVEQRIIENWARNLKLLRERGADFFQVKCEDIWSNLDRLKDFHGIITHSGFSIDFDQVLRASPVGMEKLKGHSTGEFKRNPFDVYDDCAKSFYDANFKSFEDVLRY